MPDSGIALEVEVNVPLRGAALDAELARESEGRHPVDESEVDGLRRAALIRTDRGRFESEHLRGRRLVNVAFVRKRAQQPFVAGEVRHYAQSICE